MLSRAANTDKVFRFLKLGRVSRGSSSGKIGRKPRDKELLEDCSDSGFAESYESRGEYQARSVMAGGRVVQIRQSACREVSADVGVVRLPMAVIALCDEAAGESVEEPRAFAAGALIEIARILLQECGQDCATNISTGENVGVGSPVALRITLNARSVTLPAASRIVSPCHQAHGNECERILG